MRQFVPVLILLLLLPFAQAQSIAESLQECPSTMTGSTQPEQIHLQVTDNPSEMVVIWATDQRSTAVVEWTTTSTRAWLA